MYPSYITIKCPESPIKKYPEFFPTLISSYSLSNLNTRYKPKNHTAHYLNTKSVIIFYQS